MHLIWYSKAWDDYLWWQMHDKKILQRINMLVKDIERNGLLRGIGKPERLKGVAGAYSRRIDAEHRLVYGMKDGNIEILSCRGHYDDM